MLKISELIVDLYDCQSDIDDEEFLRSTLESAANKVNAKIIQRITQKYSPSGISVILILAERHIFQFILGPNMAMLRWTSSFAVKEKIRKLRGKSSEIR